MQLSGHWTVLTPGEINRNGQGDGFVPPFATRNLVGRKVIQLLSHSGHRPVTEKPFILKISYQTTFITVGPLFLHLQGLMMPLVDQTESHVVLDGWTRGPPLHWFEQANHMRRHGDIYRRLNFRSDRVISSLALLSPEIPKAAEDQLTDLLSRFVLIDQVQPSNIRSYALFTGASDILH